MRRTSPRFHHRSTPSRLSQAGHRMPAESLYGWAIRRPDSCLQGLEVDCGATADPFHACCPSAETCPPDQYNVACCPPGKNCTEAIVQAPFCSNSSWNMYDNNGYFCCQDGWVGYETKGNSDGCSQSGESLPDGAFALAVVDQHTRPAGTTSSHIPDPTTPTSSIPTQMSKPRTTEGAIAGIVIGLVVGLAALIGVLWYVFLRKKKSNYTTGYIAARQDVPPSSYLEVTRTAEMLGTPRSELPGHQCRIHELD
ncbi:hypothetical protein F5Y18DRAFT_370062 [Xylariaceae sp. FL1019]|nr:hypothetical protein F5Y18DRAFT_370062 [Xylariaceae sp. FL1019]